MGASFAVTLANIWMKSFEYQINSTKEIFSKLRENGHGACPECSSRRTHRGKRVKCDKCENWFYAKCQNIDDQPCAKMKDLVWYCSNNYQKINKLDSEPETERLSFLRYVDDIICTINCEPDSFLRKVNTLHMKLEFTMEKPNENVNLDFLDMNTNVNSCRESNCEMYKKPTSTGVVLNFRSCAPIPTMKNIVEVIVHRVFRSTSTSRNVDKALNEIESIWLKIQYPEERTSKIINNVLQKIISKPQLKNESRR